MKTNLNPETKELRRWSGMYPVEGLFIAGMFHFALIGGANGLMRYLNIDETIPPITLDKPIDWIDIGGIDKPVYTNPNPVQPHPHAFVNNAVPNIVPEFEEEEPDSAKPEDAAIPGTGEPGEGDPFAGSANLAGTYIPGGEGEEREPEPFTIVEKEPVPILNPSPKYPELAKKAGIEGTVFIKMWVAKDGSVKRAAVLKSSSTIFDNESIETAMKWKFSPAIMNAGPVSVWVTVPFRFRLQDQ
jgi:TonB family protein